MDKTPANKMLKATAKGECPHCARPSTPYGCRGVALGWYCQQVGLQYDQSRLITPTPDPKEQAITGDEQVQATIALEQQAQQAFDQASQMWEQAIAELAEVRLLASRDEGEFNPWSGGWKPSKRVREYRRRERDIIPKIDALYRARERAAEDLDRARHEHRRALDDAHLRAGKAVLYPEPHRQSRNAIIPNVY